MTPPKILIVLPVLNEEDQLRPSVLQICDVLESFPDWDSRIIIADNGSIDKTECIG